MVVALALAAAGVEREAIVADYVATGERIIGDHGPACAPPPTYAADLDGEHRRVADAARRDLERVLEVLDERHGGAGGLARGARVRPGAAARSLPKRARPL